MTSDLLNISWTGFYYNALPISQAQTGQKKGHPSTGDKRRFKRFNRTWKIQYQCLSDSFDEPHFEEVITQNISMGGLRFESHEDLKIDSPILLKLGIPVDDEILVSGTVMWVKRMNEESFSHGVKFNDIDTDDANKLKKILPEKFQSLSYENYF